MTDDLLRKRKFDLLVGFLMYLVMGLVYAWSIFVFPLEKHFGWARAQTQFTFMLSIVTLSLGLIFGGRLSDRFSPRLVACGGTVL